MMFSVEKDAGLADIYIDLPTKEFMALFDHFEPLSEDAVPKVVDTLLVADANAFAERFEFKHNQKK